MLILCTICCHKSRVGGISESLQILLFGILFQRLHPSTQNFGQKSGFIIFVGLHQKILTITFLPKNWCKSGI